MPHRVAEGEPLREGEGEAERVAQPDAEAVPQRDAVCDSEGEPDVEWVSGEVGEEEAQGDAEREVEALPDGVAEAPEAEGVAAPVAEGAALLAVAPVLCVALLVREGNRVPLVEPENVIEALGHGDAEEEREGEGEAEGEGVPLPLRAPEGE